jgi:hypothetical protein
MISKKKEEKAEANFSSQPKEKEVSSIEEETIDLVSSFEKIEIGDFKICDCSNKPKEKEALSLDESTEIIDFLSKLDGTEIIDFKVPDCNKKEISKNLSPYTIRVKNLTDEKLYDVDLFNYEHEKQKKIEYSCIQGVSYQYFLRILSSWNQASEEIKTIRFSASCDYKKFQQKQLQTCLRIISTNPNGFSASVPNKLFIHFSAYQMQGNIIDVQFTDNDKIKLFNQLQLRLDYLMPETEMLIHIFPVTIIK